MEGEIPDAACRIQARQAQPCRQRDIQSARQPAVETHRQAAGTAHMVDGIQGAAGLRRRPARGCRGRRGDDDKAGRRPEARTLKQLQRLGRLGFQPGPLQLKPAHRRLLHHARRRVLPRGDGLRRDHGHQDTGAPQRPRGTRVRSQHRLQDSPRQGGAAAAGLHRATEPLHRGAGMEQRPRRGANKAHDAHARLLRLLHLHVGSAQELRLLRLRGLHGQHACTPLRGIYRERQNGEVARLYGAEPETQLHLCAERPSETAAQRRRKQHIQRLSEGFRQGCGARL